MDCLLQQQLLGTPDLVNQCGLLRHDWVVALPCMLCKHRLLQCPLLTSIPVLLHSGFESPHCLPKGSLATGAGDSMHHLGQLLHCLGILHSAEESSRPQDYLHTKLPADLSDILTDSFRVGEHYQWGSASLSQWWCLNGLHISARRQR